MTVWTARLRTTGFVAIAALVWLGAGLAGSEKAAPDGVGKLATSERDPLKELSARVVQLEQDNRALAQRLAKLEGAVSVGGGGVTIASAGALRLQAARIDASAATATFSGALKAATVTADTVSANTVSAKTMTPAAGNVW